MTGFAAAEGAASGRLWAWEIRGVNARGLDIRLRLPDGYGALDATARQVVGARLARGNVAASLRLRAETGAESGAGRAEAILDAVAGMREAAEARGMSLRDDSAAELLALRLPEEAEAEAPVPEAALLDGLATALDAFTAMRAEEGAALAAILATQVDAIAALTQAAADAARNRAPKLRATMHRALAEVMEAAPGADPDRVAQELALIAVKSDVTEEIDRLRAHVEAARALLAADGPVGRKLDFLAQEFNREANTLCSKAGDPELSRIGLDLKATIDQVREQVQNVE